MLYLDPSNIPFQAVTPVASILDEMKRSGKNFTPCLDKYISQTFFQAVLELYILNIYISK